MSKLNQTEWLNKINTVTQIHHKIPKHCGGKNIDSNLEELTIRNHAKVHFVRAIVYNSWKDRCSGDLILSKHGHPSSYVYGIERLKIFNEIYEKYKCESPLYYYIEEARRA